MKTLERDAQGMALGCVARGDDSVEAALTNGRYYLIVDGRNNSPGEFTLTVRFTSEALPGP